MKSLKLKVLVVCAIFALSCNKKKTCGGSSSELKSIFKSLNSSYEDSRSMDTEVHEYTFVLSSNKEVCMIGYQSIPNMKSTPYVIEILDSATNTNIYKESHIFKKYKTSYSSPSQNVVLKAGVSYTIKRIQTNWGNSIGNTIGRIARKSEMEFPYSNGLLTITSSGFYNDGASPSRSNYAIPFIDLIFK